MKLTTGLVAVIAFALVSVLGIFAVLIIHGDDPSPLVTFLAATVIPSVTGLLAYGKSNQAAHNTNGRMSELIGLLMKNGIPVPDTHADIEPSIPTSVIPDENIGDFQGKPDHVI